MPERKIERGFGLENEKESLESGNGEALNHNRRTSEPSDSKREFDWIGWQESGFQPITSEMDKVEGRHVASEFFRAYLTRKWNRRKEWKVLRKAMEMVSQLREEYPGLYAEVYESLVGSKPPWDMEEWLSKHSDNEQATD